MATTTAPPDPTETPVDPPIDNPTAAAPQNRFFRWMRGLDLSREPGWIGGVCAGIALRLGIDPLIVRGIVVVVAVLGGPALLLYAAAWLLLPDSQDKIHLEQLTKGRLESPIAGIGALVLLSLLPLAQGFWYAGAIYWGEPSWGASIARALWTAVVLGLVVWFVIWIARRAHRAETPVIVPATTDDRPETIPQTADSSPAASPAEGPAAPAADAPADEVAAWRVSQDAWKAEREQFRAEAAASTRETARLRAAEARQRSAAAAAERAERRRRRRAANPRAGAAYTAIALGGAALAGGVAALVSPPGVQAFAIGFAVAAAFLGLAMVVAGLLRRRSGFLAFLTVLALLGALLGAATPADRILLMNRVEVSNYSDGRYAMPVGALSLVADSSLPGRTIDVTQGAGSITISVNEGTSIHLQIVSRSLPPLLSTTEQGHRVYRLLDEGALMPEPDGFWHTDTTIGTAATAVTIRVWQLAGTITVNDNRALTTTTMETTP